MQKKIAKRRSSPSVIAAAALLGLAACAADGAPAKSDGRCLYHIQGEYGIYTQWGPCPSPYAMPPWKQGNR